MPTIYPSRGGGGMFAKRGRVKICTNAPLEDCLIAKGGVGMQLFCSEENKGEDSQMLTPHVLGNSMANKHYSPIALIFLSAESIYILQGLSLELLCTRENLNVNNDLDSSKYSKGMEAKLQRLERRKGDSFRFSRSEGIEVECQNPRTLLKTEYEFESHRAIPSWPR